MIQRNRRAWLIRSVMFAVLCSALFSFSEKIGGDSFTIYLNDKLLIKQYVHADKSLRSFSLAESAATDVINVNYSHCGKIGTARNITLKDVQNKTLKQWHFPDVVESGGPTMTLKARDVLAIQKDNKENRINLVYSSREMPEGKVLAAITVASDTKASLQ